MRRLLAALVILFIAVPATTATVNVPEPQPMTVCVYENKNGWAPDGDVLCTTALPAALHYSDLTLVTAGLHGGCRTGLIGNNPNWSDCISSVYIPSVAAGYRVRMYINVNYQIWRFCANGGGYWNLPYGTNDGISSFRVESGVC